MFLFVFVKKKNRNFEPVSMFIFGHSDILNIQRRTRKRVRDVSFHKNKYEVITNRVKRRIFIFFAAES